MKNSKFFKSLLTYGAFAVLIVLMASCANKEVVTGCLQGHTYGFWGGLWHGIIAPVDLVISLFRDDFTVYAQNNNGAWYAFGFLIGSGGWGFLGSKGASRKKRD
ncbi:MAG TPA: hypothetical protein PK796_12165 [Bacteroidales bacterium]|nr:hypothetical protein [Bacteroidales bacterium]